MSTEGGFKDVLGLIGLGNMGGAILNGLLDAKTLPPAQAIVYDVDPAKTVGAAAKGVAVAQSAAELAQKSGVVLLATKPQDMDSALDGIGPGLSDNTLVISIAAGISIGYIQARLGSQVRVVRVMPNTPALVNAGAAGMAFSENCTDEDTRAAATIFESIGIAERVPEQAMDTVTALSGSGPAYFFYLVECLVDAAVKLGLPEDQATRLAGQTLYGAGLMLNGSGESAATLRERVTSKGGTTAAALARFGDEGFARTVQAGLDAAAARSKELGK